ncbi:nicotinate phosphoribosyltransferase [Nostoc sp.]|uniref:nicotinate phosphoribosyltransferase n=1 Tax=Nostoc sp. TaxID=1180 RepID=UPI002FFB6E8B
MAISKIIANITQYISEAAMRIFRPTDDAYPVIGVQPFTGEPYDKRKDDND